MKMKNNNNSFKSKIKNKLQIWEMFALEQKEVVNNRTNRKEETTKTSKKCNSKINTRKRLKKKTTQRQHRTKSMQQVSKRLKLHQFIENLIDSRNTPTSKQDKPKTNKPQGEQVKVRI